MGKVLAAPMSGAVKALPVTKYGKNSTIPAKPCSTKP